MKLMKMKKHVVVVVLVDLEMVVQVLVLVGHLGICILASMA